MTKKNHETVDGIQYIDGVKVATVLAFDGIDCSGQIWYDENDNELDREETPHTRFVEEVF